MHNAITIHNNPMPLVKFQGLRVVTFAMVDEAHQHPKGMAKAAFSRHRAYFEEGRHFFELSGDVIRTQFSAASTVDWGSTNHLDRGMKHTGKKVTNLAWGMKRPGKRINSAICGEVTQITESGFTLVENLSKLDMCSLLAGGPAARKKGEDRAPALWYHLNKTQLSGVSCFALRRCRRLISPLAATIKKPAMLSPSLFNLSISSKSSRGSLTETWRERLFFLPVAIAVTPCIRWCSVYTGKTILKYLKWCSLGYTLVVFTLSTGKAQSVHKIATPRSAGTLPRRLTTTDRFCIEAAMSNITTAPQRFTFLFLAVVRANPQAHPHREQITAISEHEARSLLAGRFVLVFAGRLPVLEVSHA